jgi:hypothetical protein
VKFTRDKATEMVQACGGSYISQSAMGAKDTVVSTTMGAKDAMMNSLGMVGEKKDGTTTTLPPSVRIIGSSLYRNSNNF